MSGSLRWIEVGANSTKLYTRGRRGPYSIYKSLTKPNTFFLALPLSGTIFFPSVKEAQDYAEEYDK